MNKGGVKLPRLSGWRASTVPSRGYTSLAERLRQDLTSRQLPLTFDYLHPQPSYLLDRSLVDLLGKAQLNSGDLAVLPSIKRVTPLPPGHHLIYFPPQVTLSQLLPDGTDTLHSPGDPFHRRLWAGGRVHVSARNNLILDGSRAVCIETIRDVTVKGLEGEEKVIVRIERRIGTVQENEEEGKVKSRMWREDESDFGQSSVIENRDLVFMREKSKEQVNHDKANFGNIQRIIKPPSNPDFRQHLTPTKSLLFRFSALTFNAHRIHLDKEYTQNVEGYRSLLVHGPLTLSLLLTSLQAQFLKSNRAIQDLQYRNLAPLYVDEPLTICGKQKSGKDGEKWDVWIEDCNGSLAVRGNAEVV